MVITNGLTIGGIPIFYRALIDEFHWNRTVIALAGSITLLGAGLLVPLVGIWLDRFGVKPFLLIGTLLLGSTLLLYSRVNSPPRLYALHFLFACSLALAGQVTNVVLVSKWFLRRRGLAIGAVIMGTSIGAALFPPISARLIAALGWRLSITVLGVVVWVVLPPLILRIVRNKPEDLGLQPDGDAPPTVAARQGKATPPGYTFREALATWSFWMLVVGSSCSFYVLFAINQQFFLYLTSPAVGLSNAHAAWIQTALNIFSMTGKLFFGFLSDRWPRKRVALFCAGTMFVGVLWLLALNPTTIYAFCLLAGAGFGGTYVSIQLLVGECFGMRAMGKLLGLVTFADTLGAGGGNILTGVLYDRTGSYQLAFRLIVVCAFVAMLLTAGLRTLNQAARPIAAAAETIS
jgi:MFS family permease